MENNKIYRASEIIWNAIKNEKRIECIPKEIAPTSRNDAYQIQKNYKVFTDYEHIGYKIAATSIAGQKHINVSSPIAGMLITTGTCTIPIKFKKKDTVIANFEGLSKIIANINI